MLSARGRIALVTGILALGPGTAVTGFAQAARTEDQATFDLTIRGFRAGSFRMSAAQDGKSYAASGALQSSGLASMLKRFSYSAKVRGTLVGGRYRPASYSEVAENGRKRLQRQLGYKGGQPVSVVTVPERVTKPYDVPSEKMAGTVDPMTALYTTLRDVDAGQECRVNVVLYDGTESARMKLSGRRIQGDNVVCAGEYRRLAGFSAKELKEKTRFPFTLTYAPVAGGRMRVVSLALDTLYGTATMVRR